MRYDRLLTKPQLRKAADKACRLLAKARKAEDAAIARLEAREEALARARGEMLLGAKLKDLALVMRAGAKARRHQLAVERLRAARMKATEAVLAMKKERDALLRRLNTLQAMA